MKKLAVFPFTYEYRELLMYSKYLKEYELASCITLNEVDKECLSRELNDGSDNVITENFEMAIKNCDVILFMYNKNILLSREEYIRKMDMAAEEKKEILLSQPCREYVGLDIPIRTVTFGEKNSTIAELNLNESNSYIKNIDVPAIGIMGLGDFCNKFCTELEIGRYFEDKGYKVLHFGSKDYVELYGGWALPKFIFDKSLTVTDRIVKWNKYLFEVCSAKKPDLLVIGMPGGIMPLNNKVLNDYGEIPFILSNGVNLDVGVLCSFFYESVNKNYFDEYGNYCKYKLNCDIEFINISNSSCRFNLDSQESILEYLHYGREISNTTVVVGSDEQKLKIYNVLDRDSCSELLIGIYEKLTSGVSAF